MPLPRAKIKLIETLFLGILRAETAVLELNQTDCHYNIMGFKLMVDLTPGMKAILSGFVEGLSDEKIADNLDLDVKTVRMHINLIYETIGVDNRMQAVLWAVKNIGPHPGVHKKAQFNWR